MARQQGLQHRLVAIEQETDFRVAAARNRGASQNRSGARIAAHCVDRQNQIPDQIASSPRAAHATGRSLGAKPIKAQAAAVSSFGGHDFAAVVMTACGTDMVRTFQFAAIGTFGAGFRTQRMVRAAHIALRRRGFSVWNRHGGSPFLNSSRRSAARGLKTGGGGKPKPPSDARDLKEGENAL